MAAARQQTARPGPGETGRHGVSRGEDGSGSVLMLGVAAAACAAALALAALGAAYSAHGHAQTAADLGALAGAQARLDGFGPAEACAAARRIVEDNAASLTRCDAPEDLSVRVTALSTVETPGWSWLPRLAGEATARAGPPLR